MPNYTWSLTFENEGRTGTLKRRVRLTEEEIRERNLIRQTRHGLHLTSLTKENNSPYYLVAEKGTYDTQTPTEINHLALALQEMNANLINPIPQPIYHPDYDDSYPTRYRPTREFSQRDLEYIRRIEQNHQEENSMEQEFFNT